LLHDTNKALTAKAASMILLSFMSLICFEIKTNLAQIIANCQI